METIRRNGLSFLEETLENKNEYFLIAKELIENLFFDMSSGTGRITTTSLSDLRTMPTAGITSAAWATRWAM